MKLKVNPHIIALPLHVFIHVQRFLRQFQIQPRLHHRKIITEWIHDRTLLLDVVRVQLHHAVGCHQKAVARKEGGLAHGVVIEMVAFAACCNEWYEFREGGFHGFVDCFGDSFKSMQVVVVHFGIVLRKWVGIKGCVLDRQCWKLRLVQQHKTLVPHLVLLFRICKTIPNHQPRQIYLHKSTPLHNILITLPNMMCNR